MIKLKSNKGITLIALIITIIVLLILAGVTVAQITGQDSAPNKAAQAKLENDKGAMKDTANLVATKYIQEFYDKKYIQNDPNFTCANQGEYEESRFPSEDEGGYTYSVSGHTLTVTDAKGNSVKGRINSNGTITWYGTMLQTNIKVGENTVDLSTLDETTVGQYYGTEIVTINGKKYGLYYVDYDGYFGEPGTVYLKALRHVTSMRADGEISDENQKISAVEIMNKLNPDWSENRGTVTYDSMLANEKAVAYLCNSNNSNWSGIQIAFENQYGVDNVNYVVGAPSSEMLAKSINQAGGLSGNNAIDSRWFDRPSSADVTKRSRWEIPGYLYSTTGRNENDNTGYGSAKLSTEQKDALTDSQKSMYLGGGYSGGNITQFIASPISSEPYYCVGGVLYSGSLGHTYNSSDTAVCPLVSLKCGVDLTN